MRFIPAAFLLALLAAAPPARAGDARLAVRHEITLVAPPDGPAFRSPRAVTVDPFGNLFLADTGNHRIVRYDPRGRFVFEYGGYGWRDGELSRPTDVCAREGFRLFVADEGNERIQEFDILDETAVGQVFPFVEGNGLEDEALVRPSRIQLDREGRIYVSDPLCHCVWIFAPTGELVNRLGSLGEAPSRFREPDGVAVDAKGRVYVADTGNRRVQVFDAIGNWVAAWGGPEQDFLDAPRGLDVDADGNVWVADAAAAAVRVFTAAGVPLFRFAGGEGDAAFRRPVDVALGPDGRVWVVDEERGTVDGFAVVRAPGE